MSPETTSAKIKLIEAITTPLGFFVLALLIVESFLAIVLTTQDVSCNDRMTGIFIGCGLFILVVSIVAALVWTRPSNLTFDKDAHLVDRGKIPYGSDQKTMDAKEVLKGKREVSK
jgi:hypothetical protein